MNNKVSVFDLSDDEFRKVIVDHINALTTRYNSLLGRVQDLEDQVRNLSDEVSDIADDVEAMEEKHIRMME